MKTISLWQPWASAMALGWKKIETRSWATSYRGPLLIHAAKKITRWPTVYIRELFEGIASKPTDLPRSGILCKVDLIDCKQISFANCPAMRMELELGIYTPGRFMWITKNLMTFDIPIPYLGRQRIFEVPDEVVERFL